MSTAKPAAAPTAATASQPPRRRFTARRRPRLAPAVIVACFCIAATQSAFGVVVPVLPALAGDLHANATQLGLVVALFGVGRLAVNLPAGALSERIDPRRLLIVGMLGVVASQIAIAFVPDLGWLLTLRFIAGLAAGLAITSGMTLVAVIAEESRRGYALSVLQGVQLAAGGVGPAAGGLAASVWGNRAPFLACGAFAVLVLVFGARILMRLPRSELLSRPAPGDHTDAEHSGRMHYDRNFLAICGVGFSVFLHRFAGVQSVIPLIGYTVVGISVGGMGLLLGAVTFLNFLMLGLTAGLSDRVGRKRAIVPGLLVAGLALPVYALTHNLVWFAAVTLVTGIAATISGPAPMAYLADVTPKAARGRAVGIYRTCGDLAAVIGPIGLGFVVDQIGYRVAILAIAGVMVTTTTIFALTARETVRQGAQADTRVADME